MQLSDLAIKHLLITKTGLLLNKLQADEKNVICLPILFSESVIRNSLFSTGVSKIITAVAITSGT